MVRFSDSLMDTSTIEAIWNTRRLGSGTCINPTIDGMRLDFKATSNSEHTFGVNLLSKCVLIGDFDIQVEYKLLYWPNNNGVRIGLILSSSSSAFAQSATERISDNRYGGQVYLTDFSGTVNPMPGISTLDGSGALRMVRVGDKLTGYYLRLNDWIMIYSGPAAIAQANAYFGVAAWSHTGDVFAQQEVSVFFRNFVVNTGHIK